MWRVEALQSGMVEGAGAGGGARVGALGEREARGTRKRPSGTASNWLIRVGHRPTPDITGTEASSRSRWPAEDRTAAGTK
jgi:hypothetical protein